MRRLVVRALALGLAVLVAAVMVLVDADLATAQTYGPTTTYGGGCWTGSFTTNPANDTCPGGPGPDGVTGYNEGGYYVDLQLTGAAPGADPTSGAFTFTISLEAGQTSGSNYSGDPLGALALCADGYLSQAAGAASPATVQGNTPAPLVYSFTVSAAVCSGHGGLVAFTPSQTYNGSGYLFGETYVTGVAAPAAVCPYSITDAVAGYSGGQLTVSVATSTAPPASAGGLAFDLGDGNGSASDLSTLGVDDRVDGSTTRLFATEPEASKPSEVVVTPVVTTGSGAGCTAYTIGTVSNQPVGPNGSSQDTGSSDGSDCSGFSVNPLKDVECGLKWAFVPSDPTTDFDNFKTTIASEPPFSYLVAGPVTVYDFFQTADSDTNPSGDGLLNLRVDDNDGPLDIHANFDPFDLSCSSANSGGCGAGTAPAAWQPFVDLASVGVILAYSMGLYRRMARLVGVPVSTGNADGNDGFNDPVDEVVDPAPYASDSPGDDGSYGFRAGGEDS